MALLDFWRPRRGRSTAVGSGATPLDVLARVQRELEDVTDTFLGPLASASSFTGFTPAVDIVDCGNEVLLRADLPGLDQNEVQVEVEDGMLTLRGERKDEHEEHDDNYRCVERWEGSFSRSIRIPPGVDTNRIRAEFNSGILEVHMPKTPDATPKRIEVKGADANAAASPGAAAQGAAAQGGSGQATPRKAPAGGGAPQSK